MQNHATLPLLTQFSAFELGLFALMLLFIGLAIFASIRTTKTPQTHIDNSPEAAAKRLMLFRRAKYDNDFKQVMGNHHIDWLEEARVFEKTHGK